MLFATARPFEAALMRRYEASSRVNLVKNDDPAPAESVFGMELANLI